MNISLHSVSCSKPHSIPRTLSTYALPSFSHWSHFVAHGQPPQKHLPRPLKVMHMCWFKGHWDAHSRHTLRICTPSNWNKTSIKFPSHQHYCLHSRQVSGDDVGVAGGGLGGRPSNERIDVWYTLIVWVIKVVSLWDEWGEGRGKENRRAKVWEKGDRRKTAVVGERKAKRSRRKKGGKGEGKMTSWYVPYWQWFIPTHSTYKSTCHAHKK